jgi:hypothetical protein
MSSRQPRLPARQALHAADCRPSLSGIWKALRPSTRKGNIVASEHTPADDIVYDLVSIQYHALKGAQVYGQYLQDAEGHDDVVEFIEQVKSQDAQRAVRCHELLAQLTKNGGIG